jgi:SAM-dependent methyltransferase
VLGNWINWGDFLVAAERITEQGPRLLRRLLAGAAGRTRGQWQQVYQGSLAADPLAIPYLRRRWNGKASGDPGTDHRRHVAARYLDGRAGLTALSLCSGPGWNEAAWARLGHFSRIDGIELAPALVAAASARAREAGLADVLGFHAGDAGRPPYPLDRYDLVLCEGALHHLRPLERVIPALAAALAPGGLLVMLEFCGPDRFQWGSRQLELVQQALAMIPARWRVRETGRRKDRVRRPGRLRMILADPSEAVESSRILPLLRRYFLPLEEKPLGGTVVQLVFHGITRPFIDPDAEALALLERVCALEDEELHAGRIASDYWFGVFRAPASGETPGERT